MQLWGSKKLKALTVRGPKMTYIAANPEKLKVSVKNVTEHIMNSYITEMWSRFGTSGGCRYW